MKNQYFGDINDYRKYGLLRVLSRFGELKTAICWMLTQNDNGIDGSSIEYLRTPRLWRDYDPALYDYLKESVIICNKRNVKMIEQSRLFPNTNFYSDLVPDDKHKRENYFSKFKISLSGRQLIFFDPDNGVEIKSKPYGRTGSSKYLFWQELIDIYSLGHSILVYQHFPRVNRDIFMEKLSLDIREKINANEVYFFYTSRVLFFLLVAVDHQIFFQSRVKDLEMRWGRQLKLVKGIDNIWRQLPINYD